MNAITPIEQAEIQAADVKAANTQAITIQAAISSSDELKTQADAIFNRVGDVIDIKDNATRELVHRAAMDIRAIRLSASKDLEAFEKSVKEQLSEITKGASNAISYVKVQENKLISRRDEYDDRAAKIKEAIRFATNAANDAAGKNSDAISEIIKKLNATDVVGNADFANAKEKSLSILNTLREAAINKEREEAEAAAHAAKLAEAQAAELERLRAMAKELEELRAAQRAAEAEVKASGGECIDVDFKEVEPASVSGLTRTPAQIEAEAEPKLNRDEVLGLVSDFFQISLAEAETELKLLFKA